jgi:SAM-dependent methyltransferase
MRTLSEKEHGELRFWVDHILGGGCERELGRSYIAQWHDGAIGRLTYYQAEIPALATTDPRTWADIGCGPYPVLLHAPAHITSIMIDPLMKHYFAYGLVPPEAVGPKRTFIESFIEELPLPDETVDVVLCANCLDHVEDPWRGLQELTRIIKRGGYLIIEVDVGGETDYMHPHAFTEDELEARAQSLGLENVKSSRPTGTKRRPGASLYYGMYRRVDIAPVYQIESLPQRSDLQPMLEREGIYGFNIIRMPDINGPDTFFALHQSEGAFYYDKAISNGYTHCLWDNDLGTLIAEIARRR